LQLRSASSNIWQIQRVRMSEDGTPLPRRSVGRSGLDPTMPRFGGGAIGYPWRAISGDEPQAAVDAARQSREGPMRAGQP
jgi:hypothetical protein